MATILGSVVPAIENKNYLMGSSPLLIAYETFKVLPSDYDVGPTTVQAFIYTGAALPKKIDLSCSCLTNVGTLDWITLNTEYQTLTVATTNQSLAGPHEIVLVQSYENFAGVNHFTSF